MVKHDSRKSNLDLILFSVTEIASILIISFAIIYIPKLYEQHPLIEKYTPHKLAENAIKILPFIGYFIFCTEIIKNQLRPSMTLL